MSRRSISKSDIRGIIVPMVTPFKGRHGVLLDLETIETLSDYLIKNGVHALMPLGTSGEFALLNGEERKKVIDRVVQATSGRVPVIAGVSASGTDGAIELARDAASVGADAMISTGPYYYRTTPAGLGLHFQSLLDSVDLPLMIYNIPGWAGYNIPAGVVKQLSIRNSGRVIGVKFTTNDLSEFLVYLRSLKDEMSITIGSDSLAFSALNLGAAGAVLGSANALPKETVSIYENFSKGKSDDARRIQAKIDPFTQTMVLGTYPSALKVAMNLLGIDCGPVRRPLLPLTPKEKEQVRRSIAWKLSGSKHGKRKKEPAEHTE